MPAVNTPPEVGPVVPLPARPAPRFAWLAYQGVDLHSQFGEDGILRAIFDRIGAPERGWVVDVGAHDGMKFSNSRWAVEAGWFGILVECDPARAAMAAFNSTGRLVTVIQTAAGVAPGTTIEDLIASVRIIDKAPDTIDLLSIDVDGIDHHLWAAFTRPARVVVIEHAIASAPVPQHEPFVPKIEESGIFTANKRTFCIQANAMALDALAESKGYVLVARTRTNSIYVLEHLTDLLDESNHGLGEGVRLNIGAGKTILPGYQAWDIKDGHPAFPLPHADNSVDAIYASHILEHIPHAKTMTALREWVRVLKPGGLLQVCVPDKDAAQTEAVGGDWARAQEYVFGGQIDEHDYHYAWFNEQSLTAMLRGIGMDRVGTFKAFVRDCSSLPVSVNIQGEKRQFRSLEKPKIIAISSEPRLGFTVYHESVEELIASGLTAPIVRKGGPFWHKSVTGAVYQALVNNADLVLVLDYDSAFKPDAVAKMLDLMRADPEIAAIFPCQINRHTDEPLVYKSALDYSGETTTVAFGHFGLTLIRREVFETMPEPWLISLPNPETGSWRDEEGISDADITFWRNMAVWGFKIVQANRVHIGHGEMVLKFSTPTGVVYQSLSAWRRNGPPKNVGMLQPKPKPETKPPE